MILQSFGSSWPLKCESSLQLSLILFNSATIWQAVFLTKEAGAMVVSVL